MLLLLPLAVISYSPSTVRFLPQIPRIHDNRMNVRARTSKIVQFGSFAGSRAGATSLWSSVGVSSADESSFPSSALDRSSSSSASSLDSSLLSSSNFRGLVCVLGGFMAHLILGTLYCWGNFLSYAPSSLLFFDGLAHPGITPDAVQVMPLALVSLNLGLPIGARLNKSLGPRVTTLIGCFLMVLGTYIGSFQTRLLPFMLSYSVLAGIGTGLGYSTPMLAGWTWFPKRKGLINGATVHSCFPFSGGFHFFLSCSCSLFFSFSLSHCCSCLSSPFFSLLSCFRRRHYSLRFRRGNLCVQQVRN